MFHSHWHETCGKESAWQFERSRLHLLLPGMMNCSAAVDLNDRDSLPSHETTQTVDTWLPSMSAPAFCNTTETFQFYRHVSIYKKQEKDRRNTGDICPTY